MANDYIVINDDLRTMQIPSSITILGVESDDDVNKIPFQMPKEYCGFDLSTFEARINYMNANGIGDMYIVDDLEVDGDDPSLMNFTWLVGRNACAYKGNTQFIVCLKKFDNDDNVVQEFNTTVYSLPVLQGLETTEAVIQQNADVIEQILTMLEDAGGVDLSNYYTKAQVDALKLANPYPLNINGVDYDGSEAVELTIEGSSQTTATANGQIIHLTDAVPNAALESLTLYDSNDSVISSANVSVANKNLLRLDLIPTQTVSKGVTFNKAENGAIQATGTSTGTYAATQCVLDPAMFVVGQTYTLSSGKTSGILYLQLILNYADGTTDYLVSSNTPYTFTLAKPVQSATGSIQITASGVTVNEWIYPMIELDDKASTFVNNTYSSMTYNGSTMPVLPSAISNIWSNDSTVASIVIEYREDPVMAELNAMQEQIDTITEHDDQLDATSEHAVQNKVVTAALLTKINYPSSGINGQILTKYGDSDAVWSNAGTPTDAQVTDAVSDWLDGHPEATTTVADGSITVAKLSGDAIAQMNSNKLTTAIKNALLTLFEHVAFKNDDPNGRTYLNALEIAFEDRTVLSIDAVYTQSGDVYDTDDLDDLKADLVVTAYYDDGSTANVTSACVLSGTLAEGTSTITATYGGKSDTFNVTVLENIAPNLSEFVADATTAGYSSVSYNSETGELRVYNTTNRNYVQAKYDSFEIESGYAYTISADARRVSGHVSISFIDPNTNGAWGVSGVESGASRTPITTESGHYELTLSASDFVGHLDENNCCSIKLQAYYNASTKGKGDVYYSNLKIVKTLESE